MSKIKINYREIQRDGFCRGCDKSLPKGTMIIATYSHRNRGQYIYFCEECINQMYNLINEKMKNKLEYPSEFKCPYCKSELVIIGIEKMETLIDHVCDPNSGGSLQEVYACSNKKCGSNDTDIQIRWDCYGDKYIFGKNYKSADKFCEENAINGNNGPFGTSNRKSNVEIYYKGVKKRLVEVWPKWWLFNFGFIIEYKYKADNDGNILSRKKKLKILRKGRDGGVTYYMSGIYMLYWSLKMFRKNKRDFYENMNKNTAKKLFDEYKLESWDKRWWRLLNNWILRNFYSKHKNRSRNFKIN